MKSWKIPVTWEVYGTVEVKANTLEEAIELARDKDGVLPLPDESYYVDGSWRVTEEESEFVRSLYNDNQQDDASFTAFIYGSDGVTADLSTYDDREEAIDFAKTHKWDEVVNDVTGEVVWIK